MKGFVCLQIYKGVLEATLFTSEAGQDRESLGLSKCCQLCQLGVKPHKILGIDLCWMSQAGKHQTLLWKLILNYSS